jgi:hypothetical protein
MAPALHLQRCEAPYLFHSGSDFAHSQFRLAPIRDQPPESVPNWDRYARPTAARRGQPEQLIRIWLDQPLRLLRTRRPRSDRAIGRSPAGVPASESVPGDRPQIRRLPGYVIDHIQALKQGGRDEPENMEWQTVEEAKAKDKIE